MMQKIIPLLLLTLCWNFESGAQSATDQGADSAKPKVDLIFSLGGGVTRFFGDVEDASKANVHLLGNRGVFDFTVGLTLSKSFTLNLNGVYGKLSGNENTFELHRNFEAEMIQTGFNVEYNFGGLYKKRLPILNPFISAGVYYSNYFNIGTDLYGSGNVLYHYWSDGRIRDIAEGAVNEDDAVNISRDFSYETPLVNGSIHSFATAIGGGLDLHLSRAFTLRLMTRYFFSFTDKVDEPSGTGIPDKGEGFLLNSISLVVNTMAFKPSRRFDEPNYKYLFDFSIVEQQDEDGDGVLDMADKCAGTPSKVKVDADGCPLDLDLDGIPDYRDKDRSTVPNAIVDQNGVKVDYKMIAVLSVDSVGVRRIQWNKKYLNPRYLEEDLYTVNIRTLKVGNEDQLNKKVMTIPELRKDVINDSLVVYRLGVYERFADADSRSKELEVYGEELAYGVPEATSLQVALDLYSMKFPDSIFTTATYALHESLEKIKATDAYEYPQLEYAISRFEGYLEDGILESVLVKEFLNSISAFSWDPQVNEVYSDVKQRLADNPVPSASEFASLAEPEVNYKLIDMSRLYDEPVAKTGLGVDTLKLHRTEFEAVEQTADAPKDPSEKDEDEWNIYDLTNKDRSESEFKIYDKTGEPVKVDLQRNAASTETTKDETTTSKHVGYPAEEEASSKVYDLTQQTSSEEPEFKIYDKTAEQSKAKMQALENYEKAKNVSTDPPKQPTAIDKSAGKNKPKKFTAPVKPAFQQADFNGDGQLSSAEVEKVLDQILEGRSDFTVTQFNELVLYYTYSTGNADPIDFGGTEVAYIDGILTILKVEGGEFNDESRRLLARKYKEADFNGDGDLTADEVQEMINRFMKGDTTYEGDKIYELIDLYFE